MWKSLGICTDDEIQFRYNIDSWFGEKREGDFYIPAIDTQNYFNAKSFWGVYWVGFDYKSPAEELHYPESDIREAINNMIGSGTMMVRDGEKDEKEKHYALPIVEKIFSKQTLDSVEKIFEEEWDTNLSD